MRLSQYFLPVSKEQPREAEIASHSLMLRAGMISQSASGMYQWLPLGLKVLNNVENIVRDELNKAGCLEVKMPILQPTELWAKSGRGNYGDETLLMTDRQGRELMFSPTNEEVITNLVAGYVRSYKDLPLNMYQINWKFRDEIRPRFGVMRGREFLMKDGYSFHINADDAKREYEKMLDAYLRIFTRLGLKAIPFVADSGEIGGDMSHEFQVIAKTGESEIYYDPAFEDDNISSAQMRKMYAVTDEKYDASQAPANAKKARGIEVGHIFYLGDKYSKPLEAAVQGQDGKLQTVQMATYGIGISRLVGAIIEAYHDDAGIQFPTQIAPFKAAIVNLRIKDEDCNAWCEEIYEALIKAGVETLYDDKDGGAGAKLATQELIGTPYIIAIGPRAIKNGKVEITIRATGEKLELTKEETINWVISQQ